MRGSKRLISLTVLVALSGALAGCGGGGIANFDPSDLLDWMDTKKKLPGDRKPVFPEGVPGVSQGIPQELVKGYQEPQQPTVDPAAAAAQENAQKNEPPPKPKPKPKPKPRVVARPQPAAQQQPAAQAPWPAQPQQQPAPQAQAPWPGQQQPQQPAWPTAR